MCGPCVNMHIAVNLHKMNPDRLAGEYRMYMRSMYNVRANILRKKGLHRSLIYVKKHITYFTFVKCKQIIDLWLWRSQVRIIMMTWVAKTDHRHFANAITHTLSCVQLRCDGFLLEAIELAKCSVCACPGPLSQLCATY